MTFYDDLVTYMRYTPDEITPEEERLLQLTISTGKARLKELIGAELNYEEFGAPKELLLNYCRYALNHAEELFEHNYQKEILRLQLTEGVKALEIPQP